MYSDLNNQEYNYDYSNNNIPFNTSNYRNRNIHSARTNRNHSYDYKKENKRRIHTIQNYADNNSILSKEKKSNNSNKYRITNLEERISSLEKMLHYLDEFIHLKEEESSDHQNNINNLPIEPLIIKINLLEKEIKNLNKEKEESNKIISELKDKIASLEKKIDNYNYNSMQDIIYSLSDKEKKLNLLVNDFSDIAKESNTMINNKMNEKINEFNIFNENRINELLVLMHDINKIIEENEIKVNKFNEKVEKIQKDNLNIIKYISLQEQKINNFDLIMNEIKSLKEKFYIVMNDNNFNNNIIDDSFNLNLVK